LRRIRVLITNVPKMLYELLRAEVESHGDMEVVPPGDTAATLVEQARSARADIVILEATRRGDVQYRELLYAFPRVGTLAMFAGGREASLYELRIHETEFDDTVPAELIAAVRAQWTRTHDKSPHQPLDRGP
jgi:hypothetical protein